MFKTLTGNFPIGFRAGGSAWQKNLDDVIAFAKTNGFATLDVGSLPPDQVEKIFAAGLGIGSVDVPTPWEKLAATDAGARHETVAKVAEYICSVAALGVMNFFAVIFPQDTARSRAENFSFAVAGWGDLARAIEPSGARIVIEGYPGRSPHFLSVCCTPETYRAFFRETGSAALKINFDPSHLIRMGIDPLRFLAEFSDRIGHVHAKDTQVIINGLYEFGNLQPATFTKAHAFGGHSWRYTIPGTGVAPWSAILSQLKQSGYAGAISIELEDEDYHGSTEAEQRGLIASRDFLAAV